MDSMGLFLLIPFGLAFVMLFIVCCFADNLKKMCRLPNPLPRYYLGAQLASTHSLTESLSVRGSRHQSNGIPDTCHLLDTSNDSQEALPVGSEPIVDQVNASGQYANEKQAPAQQASTYNVEVYMLPEMPIQSTVITLSTNEKM